MFGNRKLKKSEVDEQLLKDIFRVKEEWMSIDYILKRSLEPSEGGFYQLSVAQAKYFYLLKEARHRKISALR